MSQHRYEFASSNEGIYKKLCLLKNLNNCLWLQSLKIPNMYIRKAAGSQICYWFDLKDPSRHARQALTPFDPDGHREGNLIRFQSRFCFNSVRALIRIHIIPKHESFNWLNEYFSTSKKAKERSMETSQGFTAHLHCFQHYIESDDHLEIIG